MLFFRFRFRVKRIPQSEERQGDMTTGGIPPETIFDAGFVRRKTGRHGGVFRMFSEVLNFFTKDERKRLTVQV